MKKITPKYPQGSRVHVYFARLLDYLLSYEFAFTLLIMQAQIAMYWLMLEACHG